MNYTKSSHPALGALKPEELAAFNRLSPELQDFFTQQNNVVGGQPEYGAPNDITPAGCLALARLSNQHPDAQGETCALWNEWRVAFPATCSRNHAVFAHVNIYGVDFSGFEFDSNAYFFCVRTSDCFTLFRRARFGELPAVFRLPGVDG